MVKPAPPLPPLPQAIHPRREASLKVVNAGGHYLEQGETDKAIQTFQEAINIDSDNGIAFYFLAKALYKKESYDEALGILERAQVLLSGNPDWAREVNRLRESIQTAQTVPPEAVERAIYY